MKKYICCICGATSDGSKVELPTFYFPELVGVPAVCTRCVFEKLTGEVRDWSEERKPFIKYDKPLTS
uniref:Uncharacterized protein n=1 Tax=viral metagenome TaxID=1070528 RepID=A0A6M3L1I5_9ZZZZ